MHTVTVWNKRSTNFNTNAFVRTHGTNRTNPDSEAQALRLMGHMIHDPCVSRLVYDGPNGCLTWVQKQPDEPCDYCEYDDSDDDYQYPC